LKTQSLTQDDYKRYGKFSCASIIRHLGPWIDVLSQAGLKPSEGFNLSVSDEELFENLEQLWEKLGRQPSRKDFIKPLSRCSYDCYPRRFGTYRKALEAFVSLFEGKPEDSQQKEEPKGAIQPDTSTFESIHKTSRNISWRIRFLVMRRDDFKCRLCGISPAMQPGTVLVVDHINPWASGGETVIENLQTLCEPCNGGKSNLLLKQ
jgi:5-methylcytosine-specific restriction endonuclease McrA